MCDSNEHTEAVVDEVVKSDNENLKTEFQEKSNTKCSKLHDNAANFSLTHDEIKRYSRQLILPEISVEGQVALKKSKVLIVGAGGLGCPVGMYLAAAGVGTIGIVDYDVVDVSNLHRQISHAEAKIGVDKSVSLADALKSLNSSINVNAHSLLLNSQTAKEIIKLYDVIVDASDNVPTRYLLNDAAVLHKKPLVSGSALKFEGQLTVYNYLDGPCYRCLFPNPPSSDVVTNCSDGGVLGPVTGVIGSLQALEVIKIVTDLKASYYKKMFVFDGLAGTTHVFNLRGKKENCEVCGSNPSVTSLIDYELFCNSAASDKDSAISLLSDSERVSCTEYKTILDEGIPHVLVDVRSENEMKICSLPNSFNVPISKISDRTLLDSLKKLLEGSNQKKHYAVCRRGNDSQKAVKILQKHFENYLWYDIKGGLYSWHEEIDNSLPIY